MVTSHKPCFELFCSFPFEDAKKAFETTRKGRSEDGVGVIKAIISGPE